MIWKKKEFFLSALVLFIIALALNPNLFQEGLPIDERATQNLPDRIFNIQTLRKGMLPLWNPYLFFGSPHIATHQSAFFYPPNLILFFAFPPVWALKISTFLHTFLAGLFMFLYLKRLRLRSPAAVTGALAFMMSGYFLSHECHTANRDSVIWIPLLFFFMEGFLRNRDRTDLGGGSLVFAVMIFSGYMHTVVITGFFVIIYLVFRFFFGGKNIKFSSVMGILAMLVIGGGLAAIQVLTTRGILDQTVREKISYEVFTKGYFPFSYIPLLFFPYLFGAHYTYSVPTSYCGLHNLHELTGWMDGLFLVLGGVGFFSLRKGQRRSVAWSWAAIGFLSFILCFGPENPLYRITFRIPGYNLFMGPSKNWLGVHLAVSVLSGFGLHFLIVLLKMRPKAFRKAAAIASLALFCLGILMICFILILHTKNVQSWPHFKAPSLASYVSWDNPAVWVPISTVFFTTFVLFVFIFTRRIPILLLCLPALLAQTLFLKHNMYIRPLSLENIFKFPENNAVFSFLKERERDLFGFRIYPVRLYVGDGIDEILYPCINEVYGIRSLAGYGPLFYKDFSELTHIHSTGISYRLEHLIKQNRIFSMLNAKYIILFPSNDEYDRVIGFLENAVSHPEGQAFYREAFRSPLGVRVYENLKVLPYAYGISRLFIPEELQDDPADIKRYCKWLYKWTIRFNPQEEALFMEPIPEGFPERFAPARVKIKRFQLNRIEAEVEAEGQAFVIFSEMFYPGWQAFLDGNKTRLYRVNVVLSGLLVPPGRHRIVLRYLPGSFVFGLILSCVSLALLLVTLYQWNRIFPAPYRKRK